MEFVRLGVGTVLRKRGKKRHIQSPRQRQAVVDLIGTYTSSHLGTELVVLYVVDHGENIVSGRVEPHGVIPIGSLVAGADVVHALDEVGVAGHEGIGTDSSNGA